MCGRFANTLTNPDVLQASFNLQNPPEQLQARYNVAPMTPIATVVQDETGANHLAMMKWGLVPSWSKDAKMGNKLINARAETAAEKPAFRSAFKRRRCLVIATGFYEWQQQADGPKVPMFITVQGGDPFGMAGLWENWTNPDTGEILSTCTILTTSPNALMERIHNRMPVILPREVYDDWLNVTGEDASHLQALLAPYPAEQMSAYPVSRAVNNVRNDDPSLVEAAGPPLQ